MAAFLYYLPDLHAAGRPEIQAAGLAYAFDASPATVRVSSGPDNAGGIVLADERRLGSAIGFYPDSQDWRRIHGIHAWVGRTKGGGPPGPDDLARREQIAGHWVTLADDRAWLCPIARAWSEDDDGELRWAHNLPRVLDLDDAGQWTQMRILPKYAGLWDLAERWEASRQRAMIGEADEEGNVAVKFTFADAIDAAVMALQANYRIGRTEVAMAGMLTRDLAVDVLDALIDWPTRMEWIKKKVASEVRDGGPTADGPPAGTGATGQP